MVKSPGKLSTVLGILIVSVLLPWACTPEAEPAPTPTPAPTSVPAPTPAAVDTPTPTTPSLEEEYERNYPGIIRGFWMPALAGRPMGGGQSHSVAEPETMKGFHANLAAFAAPLPYNEQGDIDVHRFESSLSLVRGLIREYHVSNISVFLTIEPQMGRGEPGQIPESVSSNGEFISGYDSCLEKLVALAEEEKVEYLAPMNEPDYKLGSEITDAWSERMLRIVQGSFTGKIVYKGALFTGSWEGRKPDFSGYSYVGLSCSPWSSNNGGVSPDDKPALPDIS